MPVRKYFLNTETKHKKRWKKLPRKQTIMEKQKKTNQLSVKTKVGRFFFSTFTLVLVVFATLSFLERGTVWRWANQIWSLSEKTPIYFAVVVPGEDSKPKVSTDIIRGVELCLAEQNQASQKYDFRMTVIEESSQDLKEMYGNDVNARIRELASRIVSDQYSDYYNAPPPVAVLGHYISSRSSVAGAVYQGKIVALTGTAMADDITESNPWYFRSVFNNSTQAEFLAEFIYKSLGHQRVYVIGQAPDKYSEELTAQFVKYFSALGGEIAGEPYILDVNAADEMYTPAINYFAAQRIEETEIPLVLLLQVTQAGEFTSRLKLAGTKNSNLKKYIFVGGDAISSVDFADAQMTKYGAQVPNYAEGTISVSPIIYDVAGYDAQAFLRNIRLQAGDPNYDPSWRAVTFYEGACALAEAVKDGQISGAPDQISVEREVVREKLAGYNSPQTAIPGIIGPVYFDSDRNLTHPIMLGTYRNGELISYNNQFSQADLYESDNLRVGDIPLKKVDVSYAGIEMIEVSNLDLSAGTFTADFYLWFLHSNPNVDDSDVEFVNVKNPIRLGDPLEEVQVGDLYYRLYRIKGDFRGQFDFRQYPFDAQAIEIKLRNAKKSYNELIYVVDVVGVDSEHLLSKLKDSEAFAQTPGWKLDNATFFQDVVSNKSALGNPAKIGSNANREFSVINYRIDLKRDVVNFTIKNMLPVLLAVIVTYVSFFLSLIQINTTRSVVTGSLLTVALMHSGLSRNLPPVDYLTMLDILFYIVYFVIFVEVGITVLAQRSYEAEDKAKAEKLMGFGRAFFPVTLVIGAIMLLLLL